jgi:hypothetical protein
MNEEEIRRTIEFANKRFCTYHHNHKTALRLLKVFLDLQFSPERKRDKRNWNVVIGRVFSLLAVYKKYIFLRDKNWSSDISVVAFY